LADLDAQQQLHTDPEGRLQAEARLGCDRKIVVGEIG
jgi:hypothetical protein